MQLSSKGKSLLGAFETIAGCSFSCSQRETEDGLESRASFCLSVCGLLLFGSVELSSAELLCCVVAMQVSSDRGCHSGPLMGLYSTGSL